MDEYTQYTEDNQPDQLSVLKLYIDSGEIYENRIIDNKTPFFVYFIEIIGCLIIVCSIIGILFSFVDVNRGSLSILPISLICLVSGIFIVSIGNFADHVYMYITRKSSYTLSNIQGTIEGIGSTYVLNQLSAEITNTVKADLVNISATKGSVKKTTVPPSQQAQTICPSCKRPVKPETKFCTICGFDIGEYMERLK